MLMNIIKEILFPLSALCFILLLLIIGGYSDTRYSTMAEVLNVDNSGTTFVDGAGYVWAVTNTNYERGQFVKLYFFNNTTDYTREDDVIVNIRPIKD